MGGSARVESLLKGCLVCRHADAEFLELNAALLPLTPEHRGLVGNLLFNEI